MMSVNSELHVSVSDRAKWLKEDFHKRASPTGRSPTSVAPGVVVGGAKWPPMTFDETSESGLARSEKMRMCHKSESSRTAWVSEGLKVAGQTKLFVRDTLKKSKDASLEADTEKDERLPPKKIFSKKKPLSAVQRRLLQMEQREAEFKLNSDHKNFMKVSWKNAKLHGKYDKKAVDVRGVAPKKSLSDLP